MRSIDRRVRRLEDRFGSAVETEFSRRLRERLEAARRRLQEAEERGLYKPPERGPLFEFHQRRLRQALSGSWLGR
jgi:hypothetical protein